MALPEHGRVACSLCHAGASVEFDRTVRTEGGWRLTANPLAWGNPEPEVVVLGFSKGPTQAGALAALPHDEIAYKGGRGNIAKILAHLGLLESPSPELVSREIARKDGRFHFGSLVRCTVERFDEGKGQWTGTGGGMLDKFVSSPFGREVTGNCAKRFLKNLPASVKLVVLFGMGSALNYVREAFAQIRAARGGEWRWINQVSYTDGKIVVVHVEHFASQGSLVADWLGQDGHERGRYGRMAREAAALSGVIGASGPEPLPVTREATPAPARETRRAATAPKAMLPEGEGVAEVAGTFRECGYEAVGETKKVACFAAPSGRRVYVVKGQLRPGNVVITADPTVEATRLRALEGEPEVDEGFLHNSNFREFPTRESLGEKPVNHGRKVRLANSAALAAFLRGYSSL